MSQASDDMDVDDRRPTRGGGGGGARGTGGGGGGGAGGAAGAAGGGGGNRGTLDPFLNRQVVDDTVSGEFLRGTVKEIYVDNFMTYGEKVVIKPGPRLNLVLGPNGTGKSSLVCALCVCLGGALKLLGRADNPRDFIRRGTLRAEVRVTLSGGGRNQPDVIVGRVLAVKTTATGGVVSSDDKVESIYTVGGQKCTEKDVRAIVADMGVQLDNLCQFLPQDKVVEFARLDAKQLLDATERAVGKGELADQHNILKTKAAVLNERIVTRDSALRRIEKLRADNAQVEREVRRYRERRELLDAATLLETRAAWLKVGEFEKQAADDEQALAGAVSRLRAAQRADDAAKDPLKARLSLALAADKAAKDAASKARANMKAVDDAAEMAAKYAKEMTAKRKELEGLHKQIDEDRDERDAKEKAVERAEDEIKTAETAVAGLERRFQKADEALEQALSKHQEASQEASKAVDLMKAAAQRVNDTLNAIKGCDSGRQLTLQRLEQHLKRTRGEKVSVLEARAAVDNTMIKRPGVVRGRGVWGPVAAEIELQGADRLAADGVAPAPRHASALASMVEAIVWPQLASFVVTTPEDRDNALLRLRPSLPGAEVLMHTGGARDAVPRPAGAASAYAGLGLVGTVDDFIRAPPDVKHALAQSCNTHNTFIAREGTTVEDVMTKIFPACDKVRRVIVPPPPPPSASASAPAPAPGRGGGAMLVTRIISRYAQGNVGSSVRALQASSMLDQAAAVEGRQGASSRREELTRRLDADKAALAERRRENEAANAVVRELGKAFQEADEAYKDARSRRRAARETVMRLQRKREINRRRVATLEEKLADPAARRRKIEDALQKAANIQRRSAVRVAELIRAAADCAASAAAAALKKAELDQQAAAIRDVSRAHEDKREEAERERAKLWKAAQMSRHRADKVMEQTRNDFPKPPAGSALARDYAAIDPSLTADQLRQQARGKKDRASTIGFGNDAVAQRYQTALQEIEKTARVASAAGKEADELTAEMDSIESAWLPRLRTVIDRINANFSANFARIGCAGEVVLVEGERGVAGAGARAASGRQQRAAAAGSDSDADADANAANGSDSAPDRPRDYAKWRAEVRVQFRASEPLSVLTAFRQSGGERSVSTILYLVALQGVTVTPFRVVDEINQGMDPVNERKVFRLLVEASTRPKTPQCFLLTPKLLPGLPFGPDVTVLSIFNGLHVAAGAASGLTRNKLYGSRYDKEVGRRAAAQAARERDARRAELLREGEAEMREAAMEEGEEGGGGGAAAAGGRGGGGGGRGDRGLLDI